jgi:hypothetical protein
LKSSRDDGAGLAHDRIEQHRSARDGRGMAHHAAHAGRRLAGFVDHDLLAVQDSLAHGPGEVESVEILEALDVDADGFDFRQFGEVAQHVAVGQVGLVAQRQHVARVEPRVLADAGDHEGAALAQHHRIALRLLLRLGQALQRNEPGVVAARMRDHAEAVGAEEDRAAAGLAVRGVDAPGEGGGRLAAGFGFAQAAGDQHHRFDRVGFDDFVDQFIDRAGCHGDDQQVELAIERFQAFHAPDAVDLGLARADDAQLSLR